jgi:hypothetical protein
MEFVEYDGISYYYFNYVEKDEDNLIESIWFRVNMAIQAALNNDTTSVSLDYLGIPEIYFKNLDEFENKMVEALFSSFYKYIKFGNKIADEKEIRKNWLKLFSIYTLVDKSNNMTIEYLDERIIKDKFKD